MNQTYEFESLTNRLKRHPVAGVVGVMMGAIVVTGVTVLFGSVSSMPWLPPTEANLALLARCERLAARAARNQCVEATVLAVQARNRDIHVAQREPAAGSGR